MTTEHPTRQPEPETDFESRLEYSTPEELAILDRYYTADAVDGPISPADRAAREVDEVAARTADPSFSYDPSAEWGEAAYREPRSQDEADARTAHLDAERAEHPPRPIRELTEVEDALVAAEQDAVLADMAHDPDPQAWAEVHRLEALADLAPLPDEPVPALDHPALDDAEHDAADDEPEVEVRDELVTVVDRDSLIFDPAAEGGFRSMTDDEHDQVLEQVRTSRPEPEYDDEEPEP